MHERGEGEPGQRPAFRPSLPTAPQQALPVVGGEAVDEQARRWFARAREHALQPSAPPHDSRRFDMFLWGLAQPALGLRVLLRHGDLFVRGLGPALAFLLICMLVADRSDFEGRWPYLRAYYATLVAAAPISPVLFTRNYAKLAAEARRHLDVARHEPYLRSFGQALTESLVQLFVVGVGVAPFVGVVSLLPVPIAASVIAWLIASAWTLHWVVVEALDSARSLPPGVEIAELEQQAAQLDPPWYAAAGVAQLGFPFGVLLLPVRLWGVFMARLGRRWRGEVQLIQAHPWMAAGFGLGAALLLAIPLVNILFRPALVVAGTHVLGRLED